MTIYFIILQIDMEICDIMYQVYQQFIHTVKFMEFEGVKVIHNHENVGYYI